MKKLFLVVLVAVILMTACEKKEASVPRGFTDKGYEIAKAAVEMLGEYNAGKLTRDEAEEKAAVMQDRLAELEKANKDLDSEAHFKDFDCMVALSAFVADVRTGFEAEDEIKDLFD